VNRTFRTPQNSIRVKSIEFVSDRVSYIVLRGCWCKIVLDVHARSENRDDSKDSFYEELEQVFKHFPNYQMKQFIK
jgi:hypothetical protein